MTSGVLIESETLQGDVVFGCDRDYPPMSYLKNNSPAGFDVEMIYKTSDAGNFKAEIKLLEWPLVIDQLISGGIDVAAGIIRTENRSQLFDFSIPYLSESYAVFSNKNSGIKTIHQLEGRKLAVLKGDAIIDTFVVPQNLDADMVLTSSTYTALQLVAAGDADYAITPYSIGRKAEEVLNLREVDSSERSLLTVEYRFAVKKGRSDLLFQLNEALLGLIASGVIDEAHKDAGFSRPSSLSSTAARSAVFHVILLAVGFNVIVIILYTMLRTRVRNHLSRIEAGKIFLESVLDSLPMRISWRSSDGVISGCNSRCRASGGQSDDLAISESEVLNGGTAPVEYTANESHGENVWTRRSYLPIPGNDGADMGVISLYEDCSRELQLSESIKQLSAKLAYKNAEIQHLKSSDSLTGLFNRAYLKEMLHAELELSSSYDRKFCVMVIEAVSSTNLNAGAETVSEASIIREVAAIIRKYLRRSDIAAFIGSRIFMVIMPKTNLLDAEKVTGDFSDIIRTELRNDLINCSAYELPASGQLSLHPELRELLYESRKTVSGA